MTPRLITGPIEEPLTLSEAKQHLRVDSGDDDALILGLISTVREQAEQRLDRPMLPQTFLAVLDSAVSGAELFISNDLLTVETVTYADSAGVDHVTTDYTKTLTGIRPNFSGSNVRVQFTAGAWATVESVPFSVKAWMLLLMGDLYENRGATAESAVGEFKFANVLIDRWRSFGV